MSKKPAKIDPFDRLFAEAVEREDAQTTSANIWARAGRDVVVTQDAFSGDDRTQDAADLARAGGPDRPNADADNITLATFLDPEQPTGKSKIKTVSETPILDPKLLRSVQNDKSRQNPIRQAIAVLGALILLIAGIFVFGQPA
ncbi:MAG: hypothetical protein ABJ327_06065 [Litoreibacter sp.]